MAVLTFTVHAQIDHETNADSVHQMVDVAGSADGAELLDEVAAQESVGEHTIMENLTDTR